MLYVAKILRGWMTRRRLAKPRPLSDKLASLSRLEADGMIGIEPEYPFFVVQYELYASLSGNGGLLQNFLSSVILLINVRRAAFNGAASEGLAVASDGRERLDPVQPSEAVGFTVCVGTEPILYGSANMYAHTVSVPD